jgi:large subunit ribosomal protein L29
MKKPSALRELTLEELRQEEINFRKELFNLKFQKTTGEIENPKRIMQVRREIARILTVTTEKLTASADLSANKQVR